MAACTRRSSRRRWDVAKMLHSCSPLLRLGSRSSVDRPHNNYPRNPFPLSEENLQLQRDNGGCIFVFAQGISVTRIQVSGRKVAMQPAKLCRRSDLISRLFLFVLLVAATALTGQSL